MNDIKRVDRNVTLTASPLEETHSFGNNLFANIKRALK